MMFIENIFIVCLLKIFRRNMTAAQSPTSVSTTDNDFKAMWCSETRWVPKWSSQGLGTRLPGCHQGPSGHHQEGLGMLPCIPITSPTLLCTLEQPMCTPSPSGSLVSLQGDRPYIRAPASREMVFFSEQQNVSTQKVKWKHMAGKIFRWCMGNHRKDGTNRKKQQESKVAFRRWEGLSKASPRSVGRCEASLVRSQVTGWERPVG